MLKLAQRMFMNEKPLFDWSSETLLDSLVTLFSTDRSALFSRWMAGAAVVVRPFLVRYSSTSHSVLISSTSS